MKKYLFIALAALGFAACAEKDEMGNQPINNGEKEQSYVAVTFTADGVTRADEYVVGTDAERAVNSAYIFFFDKYGNAFTVNGKESHPGGVNYVSVIDDMDGQPNDDDGDAMPNVSDIKDKVIVRPHIRILCCNIRCTPIPFCLIRCFFRFFRCSYIVTGFNTIII
jgi:hypothetical protein